MPLTGQCEACGAEFTGQRRTKRFCNRACKARARRRRQAEAIPAAAAVMPEQPPAAPEPAPLTTQVAAQVLLVMQRTCRVDTVNGQLALALALQIDRGAESGSAMVALARGLREILAEAGPEGGPDEPEDPVAAAEAKREKRRATS